MNMTPKLIYLNSAQIKFLEDKKESSGISMGGIVRNALDIYMLKCSDKKNEPGREAQTASRRAVGKEDT